MAPQILTDEIKREIGQHFVVGFHGFTPSQNIKTLIQDYHVGNIILMKRNIQSAKQTRQLVDDLQKLAREAGHRQPLLIGTDQENGLVSAFSSPTAGTTFPGAMALAATGSTELAERVTYASATELKMVGINWVYSPVADVNTDSRNPVIGVRSFGDDPNEVAKFAAAAMRGAVAAGVAPTAKHFPGHGDTHVDSHLALPRIEKRKEELEKEELVPFKALIGAGIPSVMTGHMALPLVTGDDTPCSLSRVITTGMLREEMGFEGVVVTDCLEMAAIAEGPGVGEGARRALEAGTDVVMICHSYERQVEGIEGAYKLVETGGLGVGDLYRSGARIEQMKMRFCGGGEGRYEAAWDGRFAEVQEKSQELSRDAYLRSTTVMWNAGVIPLAADTKHIALLTPKREAVNAAVDGGDEVVVDAGGVVKNRAGAAYVALAQALGKRGAEVRHAVYGEEEEGEERIVDGAGCVVWVLRNADVKRWQLARLAGLDLRARGVPVVVVASCGPYDLAGQAAAYAEWTACVATYEFTREALSALAAVVFGEGAGTGRVPVQIARGVCS